MPRKPPVNIPKPIEASTDNIVLTGAALELYNDVCKRWELDTVNLRLLRNACESLQAAIKAAAIVEREGMTMPTNHGVVRHPAAQLERDHRSACNQALQRLTLNLE